MYVLERIINWLELTNNNEWDELLKAIISILDQTLKRQTPWVTFQTQNNNGSGCGIRNSSLSNAKK